LWFDYVQASISIRDEIVLEKQKDLMLLLTLWFLRSWFDDINKELTNDISKQQH